MRRVFQSILALAVVVRGELRCDAMFAEMTHRQRVEHGSEVPFARKDDSDILGDLHYPTISFNSNAGITYGKVLVGVGNEGSVPDGCPNGCVHPQTPSNDPDTVHFITTIMIVDENNAVLAMGELTAEDNDGKVASLEYKFPTPKTMTPYVFCSIHGLWKGETVITSTKSSNTTKCEVSKCLKEKDAVAVGSSIAALKHRQYLTYSTKDAFPVKAGNVLNSLHRPVMQVLGKGIKLSIGMGADGPDGSPNGGYHPVTTTTDAATVHWPEYVYVVNEAGTVVYFNEIKPDEPDPVMLYFETPADSTTLTAYVYCNIHGLFVGEPITVQNGDRAPAVTCGFTPF